MYAWQPKPISQSGMSKISLFFESFNGYSTIGDNSHKEVISIKDSINPEIVLIVNSITHLWGGELRMRWADEIRSIISEP